MATASARARTTSGARSSSGARAASTAPGGSPSGATNGETPAIGLASTSTAPSLIASPHMTTNFASPQDLLGAVGSDLGTTDWVTITQDQIDKFAEATLDNQWIHVDTERAKAGPFGTPIAHGFLTMSLAAHFLSQLVHVSNISMGINYGADKVRFPAPVPVNSRVRAKGELLEAKEVAGGVQATTRITIEREGGD